jgi:GT2 family glycosyltransferase
VNSPVQVSILIVCYKARRFIDDCLRSIERYTVGCSYEILLVDCSADGTENYVQQEYPDVRIIPTDENLGFSRGNNLLAAHARGTHLLLLNPDTIIEDDAIGEVYRTYTGHDRVGAVGGWAKTPEGQRDPGCQQTQPTLTRLALFALLGAGRFRGGLAEDAQQAQDVDVVSGAFMMVQKSVWDEVGGMDASYFLYGEEIDICHRLHERGYRVLMTPRAEIIHLGGSGVRFDRRRTTLRTQAWMHFMRKRWSPARALAGGVLLWLNAATRYFIGRAFPWALGKQRAVNLSNAYRDITLQPGLWWNGYHGEDQRKARDQSGETSKPQSWTRGSDQPEDSHAGVHAFACTGMSED